MKKIPFFTLLIVCFCFAHIALGQKKSTISSQEITYSGVDAVALKGYVAFDKSKKGKRPAIIIVHEWWGSNGYVRKRADMLAKLGYIAIAVDMYGEGKQGNNPAEATALATPFYKNPQLAKERIEAALATIKTYAQTDTNKIAAIGYCFGGSMVLNAAKLGMNFKGVVSFHGGLAGVPAQAGVTKADILVCHGAADKFISEEELKNFKDNLDTEKVPYTFKSYANATHAFSNPDATANGIKFKIPIEYNAAADKKSWEDMKVFFAKIFK
jgi:dienelactone hydrolase